MSRLARVAERIWYGRDPGAGLARAALAPAAALFRGVVTVRGALYARGLLRSGELPVPALSVGNLTVGGTGKTPVAAWLARRLVTRGAHPALVLRGVGDDEPRVHALLNPDVPVVADADRVAGVAAAVALGADMVVLDDAFQHRRARRDADVVLVSAERFDAGRVRLLPAGPYREGLAALRRADAVVVTRKVAPPERARAIAESLGALVARAAVLHLAADRLCRWDEPGAPGAAIDVLAGARVLAVAGIAEPAPFVAQLRQSGARVDALLFGDHHAYGTTDVETLARRADGMDRVVCTLKDAVKLGPRWPRQAPPLWYVSQRVIVEHGDEALALLLDRMVALRSTAGRPGTAEARPRAMSGARTTTARMPASDTAGPDRRE